MNVLVACEESQEVCKAFRALGHRAFSCDLQECSGGHPEWHICGDVLPLLNGDCWFVTSDLHTHTHTGAWDLIIAHPPCTDLAVSGARHFEQKQKDGRQQRSIVLFMEMALANCPRIAVENPVGIMSSAWKKPTQIIQPYEFGDPHRKTTCLWLKGLPPLKPTKIVEPTLRSYICKNGKKVTFDTMFCETTPGVPRAKTRSKTFPGIARAMAEQWGGDIRQEATNAQL
jgi:site-specific DNA-cytosine methylase